MIRKKYKTKNVKSFFLLSGLFAVLLFSSCNEQKVLHIYGVQDNDLVKILEEQKIKVELYSNVLNAAKSARRGEGVLILADNYPKSQVDVDEQLFQIIEEKELRAYIEFPSGIPGVSLGKIEKAKAERAVVNSAFFGGFPDSLSILGINGLHYISTPSGINKAHIVAAKVAGFDSAIFGLPEKHFPLLFEMENERVLVATTNLSRFVSGRYAPAKEWASTWSKILEFVLPGVKLEPLHWEPVVKPSYAKADLLPEDFQRNSILRGVEWYKNARMLIPHNYKDSLTQLVESGIEKIQWNSEMPIGDGSNGVFECIFSEIDENGKQPIGIMERGDCISETAMAFATAGRVLGNEEYTSTAGKLLDYYLFQSIATKNEYGNPEHGAYGLIAWGISKYTWYRVNYGDDNARFLLAAWTTAAFTDSDRWDEIMMKSLIALLRTTGQNGFRGSRINLPDFDKNDWEYYFNQEIINPSPHFECYLWACFLWAYDKTGDTLFLDRAKKGISKMMELYPDKWKWTNGLAQEKARMILPLSWLVRVEDTAENREMLFTLINDFLKLQDKSGAIREELGEIKMGRYPPPQSNKAYGTTEASLIAQNGDPVSDLLYTTNFAFLGMHEAAYATKDPKIIQATDKLAEFLCRIQVESKGHPELDGGWMRSFDYERFEHWGSNADHGWGAWAIETGWTQGWITSILALRELDTSIWDLTKDSKIAIHHKKLKEELLPQK
jgi:hypothetical protein